jgi:hypothetical protein
LIFGKFWAIQIRKLHPVVMKSAEFNLPKNEVETEAEMHAEETRRAVSSAPKGQGGGRKKTQRSGRRQSGSSK